jgi:DNA-binding NarL/FixJ family response regulator/signal transduction histidine kinase
MGKEQPSQTPGPADADMAPATPTLPPARARARTRTRARTREAERGMALAEITRAIAASLDFSSILGVAAQQAGHILAHDGLIVLLREAEPEIQSRGEVVVAACHPPALEASLHSRHWPLTDFSFGPAMLANQSVVIEDLASTAAQHRGGQVILNNIGRSAVMVPIQAPPRVLGGLVLISRTPGLYRQEDALLVEPLAGLLALALEHQRLDQQARALAVAEERNRLAREIHDTLAQSLAGIIINLESFKPYDATRSQTKAQVAQVAEVLAETETLARRALHEARRSVLGLHPTPLQDQSLRDALTSELTALAKRAGLTTRFYVGGAERPLAPDVATALFRVAQEAFQNIYKHAAARHVTLGLAFEEEAVVLSVEDDGVGFVPEAVAQAPSDAGGFGLLSMAARARSLGGDLQVISQPGHGTTVRATIPYLRPGIATAAVVSAVVRGERPTPPPSPSPVPPSQVAPTPLMPIRVLVVDDHLIVRQGIRAILEGQPDMQVVGEAEDGLDAVEQTSRLRPDVVLLDVQLPPLSGIEALPRLRAAHPEVEVVMLTMFDQDEQVFASLKAGARGYVLKDAAAATIVEAVRAASRGQSLLTPTLTTRVVERFTVLAQQELDADALTERELEVLECMAKGMPYKEIATRLEITTNTVQYHVTNILQKLHVRSRGEAVAAATQRGLLKRVK